MEFYLWCTNNSFVFSNFCNVRVFNVTFVIWMHKKICETHKSQNEVAWISLENFESWVLFFIRSSVSFSFLTKVDVIVWMKMKIITIAIFTILSTICDLGYAGITDYPQLAKLVLADVKPSVRVRTVKQYKSKLNANESAIFDFVRIIKFIIIHVLYFLS